MVHIKKPALVAILVGTLFTSTMPVALASSGGHPYGHPDETLDSIGRFYGANPNCSAPANNCCGRPTPGPKGIIHLLIPVSHW
jgi:hypothetical protein